jgi:S1-C subfamily serine protease
MYQRKDIYKSGKWRHRLYAVFLLGVMCLALVCLEGVSGRASVAYADGVPGGNISDPVVRAVDIAKPAVVRILTQIVGQLTVNFSNGQSVTFPQTSQNGVNGYPLLFSGTGAFISAHGDILTADHVVNPVQDDRQGLDQDLQQTAAQDVADYINQNLKPSQQVTADEVAQELASGQLASTSQYQQPLSLAYLSTDFSGPLSAASFREIPQSQFAQVDQIKQHSAFNALDIAIIHVNGMDDMPMLHLGDSSAVQEQDQLTIVGFPGNGDVSTDPTDLLTSSINQVLVSSIKTTDSGSPLIQVGGNVEQGDSGGPALDSKGNVVGIVSFGAAATSGSTSFLRTSNSAQQLIQEAGIDTTPSPFQKGWSQAFNDYASQVPGHWHKATQEFQQLANQYPQFKAINQFVQYASQQAQTEKVTQEPSNTSGNGNPNSGGSSAINPLYIIAGGGALLLIVLVVAGLAVSRRRQPAVTPGQIAGYTASPNSSFSNQYYGATPLSSLPGAAEPQPGPNMPVSATSSPIYPPQPGAYRPQAPMQPTQQGYQPTVPQQSYQPAAPQQVYRPQTQSTGPVPQQFYQPRSISPSQNVGGMSAFGAPSVTPPPAASGSDATLVARPKPPVQQWRSWPCGHINRDDAQFCGVCGEPRPSR